MVVTSSRDGTGISDLLDTLENLASQTQPERLFQWFGQPIPKVYQQVGVLLRGLRVGLEDVAAAVNACALPDEAAPIMLHFMAHADVLGAWKAV